MYKYILFVNALNTFIKYSQREKRKKKIQTKTKLLFSINGFGEMWI